MKFTLCCVLALLLGLASHAEAYPEASPDVRPEQVTLPSVQPRQVGILSHETEITERQPQRLTPESSQGAGAVFSVHSAGSQPLTQASPPAFDVYSLSPSAHLLALPSQGRTYTQPRNGNEFRPPSYANASRGDNSGQNVEGLARKPRPLPPEWQGLIREASQIFGLEEGLLEAVIRVESGFDAWAVSSAGAQGAMQIMPHTQRELGLIDPFDPRANIYAGAEYLLRQMQRFGDIPLALAAYNAGPANVEKHGGIPPFTETQQYVKQVMKLWQTAK